MLSLIICSRHSDISQALKDNIQSTIGVDYELVIIDNSKNTYSIYSAYNKGVRDAKGDIFCFMHEDIFYETDNWGANVYRHFKDVETGLLGVFGGHYLPDQVCHIGDSELLSGNYYFQQKDGDRHLFYSVSHFSPEGEVEVVAVDGLWFAIPRSLFDDILFDESYAGFHYYDMDICMQIWSKGYKCKVIDDVVMTHNSSGTINDDFIKSSYHFLHKWHSSLPMVKGLRFDDDVLRISKSLCQYKRYCRELEWENGKFNQESGIGERCLFLLKKSFKRVWKKRPRK